jgi:hypothetical protein
VSTDPMVDVLMSNLNAYAMNHSNFCALTYGTQPMAFGALAAGKLFLVPESDQMLVQSAQHPHHPHITWVSTISIRQQGFWCAERRAVR